MTYKIQKLVLEDGQELDVPMREDGYILATKMCQASGKRLVKWRSSSDTKKFVKLVEKDTSLTEEQLILVKRGGNEKDKQGTWVHPKLAIHLALYISSYFCLQVTNWIEEWIGYKKENGDRFTTEIYNLKIDDDDDTCNSEERNVKLRLQEQLGGDVEVATKVGFIDLLTNNEIIEIKEGRCWKHAVGQVLMYAVEYPDKKKRIHLFGSIPDDPIEEYCSLYDIAVSYDGQTANENFE